MNRRGFMKGLLATTTLVATGPKIAPALPSGTVTGRWTSNVPNWHELTRSQVKEMMFLRNYGAARYGGMNWQDIDYTEVERRVLANSVGDKS